jgi:glycine cleavage system pyridoxal-binding protein P
MASDKFKEIYYPRIKYCKYTYKIQWLIEAINFKDIKTILKIIGVKSLDKICLRDYNLKVIEDYNKFLQFPIGLDLDTTLKDLKKIIKKNKDIYYIELLRK